MPITVTVDQNFPNATITVTDDRGNPAVVDGVPVWASSDETVLVPTPAADGMSGLIDTVAPGGPARVSVTVDADLGTGTKPLVVMFDDITVTGGAAAVITGDLGAPADKAPPGP
jgi:hypothetical protein